MIIIKTLLCKHQQAGGGDDGKTLTLSIKFQQ